MEDAVPGKEYSAIKALNTNVGGGGKGSRAQGQGED